MTSTDYTGGSGWASQYGKRALEDECFEIRSKSEGERDISLFRASASVFSLVAGGEIAEGLAYGELFAAGLDTGLRDRKVRSTLKSARKRGFRQPRRAPLGGNDRTRETLPITPARRVDLEPEYQPLDAVNAVFEQAVPVTEDADVVDWLHHRGIDPVLVERYGLARSLPSEGVYPKDVVVEVFFEGLWMPAPIAGIRLLVPFFDVFGKVRSGELVRACIEPPLPAAKSLALKGARAKLVMANSLARGLLRREDGSPSQVVIVEGVSDFLTASVEDHERAVFGIVQGSWQPFHAERIPKDADVIIATDDDPAGDRYADTITKTLKGRRYGRWRPCGGMARDVNDCGGIAGGQITWKT